MSGSDRERRYPVGASLHEHDLRDDLYTVYAKLRAEEPVSWLPCLSMWWVVGHADVTAILMDSETFVTEGERSTIRDTFGPQMLSVEGRDHTRTKNAALPAFRSSAVASIETRIAEAAERLLDGFAHAGEGDLRSLYANRLPVETMLAVFGLPPDDGPQLRQCYDAFERALSNFAFDEAVRAEAREAVSVLHGRLQTAIARERAHPSDTLLGRFVRQPPGVWKDDEEICRNASIILFGGISTVEALILNTVWTLDSHLQLRDRMLMDPALLPLVIEEVIRWQAPVQSATRHVTRDVDFHGHTFRRGDIVGCMLGAANRDPSVFTDPDRLDIDRPLQPRHLSFAVGPHVCLGLHLARLEAKVGLMCLYERLGDLHVSAPDIDRPLGYEFRQPDHLHAAWRPR